MLNHRKLVQLTESYDKTTNWLMEEKYIPSMMLCSECINKEMKLERIRNLKRWRCTKCSNTRSILHNTILENCNKTLNEIIDLIYFWSLDLTQCKTKHEANTNSSKTVFNWYKKLSLQSYFIMRTIKTTKIGGVGRIIEVDEAKFSKRKFNVGRAVRSPWVIGGVDIHSGEMFFVEVIRRNSETIKQVLTENIEIGSTVITDCWAGYVNLESYGYFHLKVNHSENFIDPLTGANTQAIENRWSVLKRKMRARFITSKSDLSLMFAEFLFKLKFKNDSFIKLMENLNKFN